MLFDSGLCQRCDAQAKRGTAAVKREAGPDTVHLCKRGCGQPRHRGNCKRADGAEPAKPKRPYARRKPAAGSYPKVTKRATTESATTLATIDQLRLQYQREIQALNVKLEVLDDVEKAIKAAK